jgi:DNA-binding response OmpR family regulator
MEQKVSTSKILIIEDNKMLLDIYVTIFEKAGYEVLTAQTGEEGYDEACRTLPNIVLLDIMLPGELDGLDVLRKLKENEATKNIPALIMSNLSDEKTISEGMALGASGYFTKSKVYPDDVLKNVASILRR